MSSLQYRKPSNAGFSLIEILVGMVMGLISMLIVMQVFATFEGQKRTTTSGSDAQTNGGIALYTIERDIRMSGYGFSDALGCTVNTAINTAINRNPAGPSFVLAPVTITQGVGGLPDTISVMASNKQNWSEPVSGSDHSLTPTSFAAGSTLGMAPNDLIIAYETYLGVLIKPCTMFQVSNTSPVINPVSHTSGMWNSGLVFPSPDYSVNSMLMNVGSLMVHYYSLDANSNLVTQEYDSSTNTGLGATDPVQTLFPDVVNLQAQYGFDTRSTTAVAVACPTNTSSGQCSIVNTWSDTMIDADGSGVTGDAGDIGRIYAVRFAVVARSGLKEKPDPATGLCNTTSASNNPDNRPSWANGIIDVSKNPDGTANPDWMCYRYKTFETVVPLRNAIWKQR